MQIAATGTKKWRASLQSRTIPSCVRIPDMEPDGDWRYESSWGRAAEDHVMFAEIDRVYEYRALLALQHAGGRAWGPQEAERIDRLERALPLHLPTVDDPDPRAQLPHALPAHFTVMGEGVIGVVRVMTGMGLCLVTAEPPHLGNRIRVHVADPSHGVEYVFPGRVVARIVRGTTSATVSFTGAPSLARSGGRVSGVWRPDRAESVRPDPYDAPTAEIPSRKG